MNTEIWLSILLALSGATNAAILVFVLVFWRRAARSHVGSASEANLIRAIQLFTDNWNAAAAAWLNELARTSAGLTQAYSASERLLRAQNEAAERLENTVSRLCELRSKETGLGERQTGLMLEHLSRLQKAIESNRERAAETIHDALHGLDLRLNRKESDLALSVHGHLQTMAQSVQSSMDLLRQALLTLSKASSQEASKGAGEDSQTPSPDAVSFAVYAPRAVRLASPFVLAVWSFLESQRGDVMTRALRAARSQEAGAAGPTPILRGRVLTIEPELPGCAFDPHCQQLLWAGTPSTVTFRVTMHNAPAGGRALGRVLVNDGAVPIFQFHFGIEVASVQESAPGLIVGRARPIKTIFASYASEDRPEVLQFKRGAQAVGVEVFVDVLDLRAGDDWEEAIRREVPSRDLFCLFWSLPASQSSWVEKEWKCALHTRGPDYIYPVPLADPRDVKPPAELARLKHFNDPTRIVIDYEARRFRGDRTPES